MLLFEVQGRTCARPCRIPKLALLLLRSVAGNGLEHFIYHQ